MTDAELDARITTLEVNSGGGTEQGNKEKLKLMINKKKPIFIVPLKIL